MTKSKAIAKNHAECIKALAKEVGRSVLNKYDQYGDAKEEIDISIGLPRSITLADKVEAILTHLNLVVVKDSKPKCVKRSSRGNFAAGATVCPEAPTLVADEEGPL